MATKMSRALLWLCRREVIRTYDAISGITRHVRYIRAFSGVVRVQAKQGLGGRKRIPKVKAGAGDETRTRDFNLGKEAVAGCIQTTVLVSPVRFLPVFSNPFVLAFLWSATLFSTASSASS
jgi:hypothetical protein